MEQSCQQHHQVKCRTKEFGGILQEKVPKTR